MTQTNEAGDRVREIASMEHRPAYWTHDADAVDSVGHLYYFAPTNRAPGPYKTQSEVRAIIDIAADGTLAGVELIDNMPPPPVAAAALSQAQGEPGWREGPPPMIPPNAVEKALKARVLVLTREAIELERLTRWAAADNRRAHVDGINEALAQLAALPSPSEGAKPECNGAICQRRDGIECADGECDVESGVYPNALPARPPQGAVTEELEACAASIEKWMSPDYITFIPQRTRTDFRSLHGDLRQAVRLLRACLTAAQAVATEQDTKT